VSPARLQRVDLRGGARRATVTRAVANTTSQWLRGLASAIAFHELPHEHGTGITLNVDHPQRRTARPATPTPHTRRAARNPSTPTAVKPRQYAAAPARLPRRNDTANPTHHTARSRRAIAPRDRTPSTSTTTLDPARGWTLATNTSPNATDVTAHLKCVNKRDEHADESASHPNKALPIPPKGQLSQRKTPTARGPTSRTRVLARYDSLGKPSNHAHRCLTPGHIIPTNHQPPRKISSCSLSRLRCAAPTSRNRRQLLLP